MKKIYQFLLQTSAASESLLVLSETTKLKKLKGKSRKVCPCSSSVGSLYSEPGCFSANTLIQIFLSHTNASSPTWKPLVLIYEQVCTIHIINLSASDTALLVFIHHFLLCLFVTECFGPGPRKSTLGLSRGLTGMRCELQSCSFSPAADLCKPLPRSNCLSGSAHGFSLHNQTAKVKRFETESEEAQKQPSQMCIKS